MHFIPGLRLRLDNEEAEIIGIDDAEMGEFAYDYVGIDAELHTSGQPFVTAGGREPEHEHHTKTGGSSDTGEKA